MSPYNEYDLFLPCNDDEGRPFPEDRYADLRENLVSQFGGLTETNFQNEGLWKIGPLVIQESVRVWRVLASKDVRSEAFMKSLKEKLEIEFKQQKILIVRREVLVL